MNSRKRGIRIALAGLVSLIAGSMVLSSTATGERVRSGNLEITVDGSIKPKKLPKRGMAPVALNAKGSMRTLNGEHPPPTRQIVIDFDKAGTVFNRGLATCSPSRLENRTTKDAMRACKPALVGRGRANAQVAFPDQKPFLAPAPLLLFNAPSRGRKPAMVIHAYANVPAPTAFVVPVRFQNPKNKRLYRHRVNVRVPLIAGDNGSMLSFDTTVKRSWRWKKKKRSYVLAGCPRGVHRAEGTITFKGGDSLKGSVLRKCRGVNAKRKRR